jgi:hypothetical protein
MKLVIQSVLMAAVLGSLVGCGQQQQQNPNAAGYQYQQPGYQQPGYQQQYPNQYQQYPNQYQQQYPGQYQQYPGQYPNQQQYPVLPRLLITSESQVPQ